MVSYLSPIEPYALKEEIYLKVRQTEGRLLQDEEVKNLPHVSLSSPYSKEWEWRALSLNRLKSYFSGPYGPKRILDLGCGNGWMADKLAENQNLQVWAVDLNRAELEQGARLFTKHNLRFVYADVLANVLPENHFDAIILAAAAQYFPDWSLLFRRLSKLLTVNGEVHIIDTPLYKDERARVAAHKRTEEYYTHLGVPEMAHFYHHHTWEFPTKAGAKDFNNTLYIKLMRRVKGYPPFPWLHFGGLRPATN